MKSHDCHVFDDIDLRVFSPQALLVFVLFILAFGFSFYILMSESVRFSDAYFVIWPAGQRPHSQTFWDKPYILTSEAQLPTFVGIHTLSGHTAKFQCPWSTFGVSRCVSFSFFSLFFLILAVGKLQHFRQSSDVNSCHDSGWDRHDRQLLQHHSRPADCQPHADGNSVL